MLETEMLESLNRQWNFERYSAAIYHALANHLDAINLTGFAKYIRARGDEEQCHARKFEEYILDRGGRPDMAALPKPETALDFTMTGAALSVFAAAYEHEKAVTERIKLLYAEAGEAEDYQTLEFLHSFLKEQVEEERTLQEHIAKLTLAGSDAAAILFLDHEIGA